MYLKRREVLTEACKQAEALGMCYRPLGSKERRSLLAASPDVTGMRPQDGLEGAPRFVRVGRNLYMRRETWESMSPDELMLSVIKTHASFNPDWVFSHYSAALLHRLDVSYQLLDQIHIACPLSSKSQSTPEVRRHFAAREGSVKANGVRCTTLEETLLGCMCLAPFEFSLGIVDSAIRMRRTSAKRLGVYFEVHGKNRRGILRAREALKYADGRAENGGESHARAVMIEEGFAPHRLQVEFDDPFDLGRNIRGDFGWELEDGRWIIGELDGKGKYIDPGMLGDRGMQDVLLEERLRESRLSAYGVKIMRFPYSYVLDRSKLVGLMQIYGVPRSEIPLIP